jgi:hypothetical protein
MVGTIMVESEETNAKLDKANLIITAKTLIFKEQDGKRVRARNVRRKLTNYFARWSYRH